MEAQPKSQRQKSLARLIDSHKFTSQDDIVREMTRAGFAVTQSLISRDIKELGIGKLGGVYRTPAEPPSSFQASIKFLIQGATPAGKNLVVVKTSAGAASAVAEAIDLEDIPGVVGTVAGDNTIFVAIDSLTAQKKILKKLESL